MKRFWRTLLAALGWALCRTGMHVPAAGQNTAFAVAWWCDRCGKPVDGGLSARSRERRRQIDKQRRGARP